MESTGYALVNFMQLLLAWGIALVMYALPIIALVYVIRYLKRFAAITEENLELNRQRTVHLEKIATVLVSMKKSGSQGDLPL